MRPTKFIRKEVPVEIEHELNQWCYDSHLWVEQIANSVARYKCRWCGYSLYTVLNMEAFKKPCPKNPRIKKEG